MAPARRRGQELHQRAVISDLEIPRLAGTGRIGERHRAARLAAGGDDVEPAVRPRRAVYVALGVIAYVVPLCAKCTTHPPRSASQEGGGAPDVASESICRTQLPPRGERSCTNKPLPTRGATTRIVSANFRSMAEKIEPRCPSCVIQRPATEAPANRPAPSKSSSTCPVRSTPSAYKRWEMSLIETVQRTFPAASYVWIEERLSITMPPVGSFAERPLPTI